MKQRKNPFTPTVPIDSVIHTVRGIKVILASDLAKIYGVETRALNQAIKRNKLKFPGDFMFQLTRKEAETVRHSRSQLVILKRGANIKYLPYAFTEHGAIMAATVLNSESAVHMSLFVVRAFIKMRQTMVANKAFFEKLHELEKKLTTRLDTHEQGIMYVLSELRKLMEPPEVPEPKRRPIGFGREEE